MPNGLTFPSSMSLGHIGQELPRVTHESWPELESFSSVPQSWALTEEESDIPLGTDCLKHNCTPVKGCAELILVPDPTLPGLLQVPAQP